MLTIKRKFPVVKATTIGAATFCLGMTGTFALLNHFQLGMKDTNVANVAPVEKSKTTDTAAHRKESPQKADTTDSPQSASTKKAQPAPAVSRQSWTAPTATTTSPTGSASTAPATQPSDSSSESTSSPASTPTEPAPVTDPLLPQVTAPLSDTNLGL